MSTSSSITTINHRLEAFHVFVAIHTAKYPPSLIGHTNMFKNWQSMRAIRQFCFMISDSVFGAMINKNYCHVVRSIVNFKIKPQQWGVRE